MKERLQVSAEKTRRFLPALFFLFVFFLYFSLLGDNYFTDEQDVWYGGYSMLKGSALYSSYLSQHMPFSYYFAAVIAACGARSVYQFRLGMDVLLSGVWTLAFLRHRGKLPTVSLVSMPLIYLSMLRLESMGTSMISDHWQGLGLLLILLELVRFSRERDLSLPMAGMVALGILLSFGTAFLSAYPLGVFFLGVLGIEVEGRIRRRKRLGMEASGDPALWADRRRRRGRWDSICW